MTAAIDLNTLSTFAGLMPVLQFMPSIEVLEAAVLLQSKILAISILCFLNDLGYCGPMDGYHMMVLAAGGMLAVLIREMWSLRRKKP
jgi:hypothetical protein